MAITQYVPLNLEGGITYKQPTFNWGDTSQGINGGLSFDLPLATASSFLNTALTFSAQNSTNAQNFLTGVIGQAQSKVSSAVDQSYAFQNKSLESTERMNQAALDLKRFEVKKKYSIAGLLKPGCFITTAVCHTFGLGDNCAELQTLRHFRDTHLQESESGMDLVIRYYDIAPRIVEVLDANPNSAYHYNYMLHNFIHPAIQHIASGRLDEATDVYVAMVEYAKAATGVEE